MSNNRGTQLSKICFCCFKERSKSDLVVWKNNFKTYCRDIAICGNQSEHPYNTEFELSDFCGTTYQEIFDAVEEMHGSSVARKIGKTVSARPELWEIILLEKMGVPTTQLMTKILREYLLAYEKMYKM